MTLECMPLTCKQNKTVIHVFKGAYNIYGQCVFMAVLYVIFTCTLELLDQSSDFNLIV